MTMRHRERGSRHALPPLEAGTLRTRDGHRVSFVVAGAADGVPVAELPLEPATNRQILARVLRNLKAIYRDADKPQEQLDVLNRMLLVAPESSAELRDRGIVYQRLECYRAALKDLTDYVEREPDAPDGEEVRVRLMELSSLCARLN